MTDYFKGVIKTLLKGIKSDFDIDPIDAANRFQVALLELDCEFHHKDGSGYVFYNDELELLAYWEIDGVRFQDIKINSRTLPIIQVALMIISEMDEETINKSLPEEDSDSDTEDLWL